MFEERASEEVNSQSVRMGFSTAASGNIIHNRNNSRFGVFGFRATALRTSASVERAAAANQSDGVWQSPAISRSEESSPERQGGVPREAERDGFSDSV